MKEQDILSPHNLKNIRQIGSPIESDKIYIEARAYERIHVPELDNKRIFVLMGHTQSCEDGYGTFVEAVIPVRSIVFDQGIPIWNNRAWSEVFDQIKQHFEDSIIVGWACNREGIFPRLTPQLEAIHCEQFGGRHQLFFLLDSTEQEEIMFKTAGKRLLPMEGFYIYYDPNLKMQSEPIKPPEVHTEEDLSNVLDFKTEKQMLEIKKNGPLYREYLMHEKPSAPKRSSGGILAMLVIAVLVLLGIGVYTGRISIFGKPQTLLSWKQNAPASSEAEDLEEDSAEIVPVEKIPGGEILWD